MKKDDLFGPDPLAAPLAERVRPKTLDELVGQEKIAGPGTFLRGMIENDEPASLILYGPPGSGKTTIANIIARSTKHEFVTFSAVDSGVKQVRETVEAARERLRLSGRRTVLFVDEVHRFNKAQQDAFLPHVENGTIILVGATTENPSFEVNAALLSRCKVLSFGRLEHEDLGRILDRALTASPSGLGALGLTITDEARKTIAALSDGDARRAISILEAAAAAARPENGGNGAIDAGAVARVGESAALGYDKAGEEHFNLISALHKSMRGSDPQAALYWLARMIEGGEDPLYIARRILRFASEDVGLADLGAMTVALQAFQAAHDLGWPEADTALAQAVVYLALAPKSNSIYKAVNAAKKDAREKGSLPVPMAIRNPVTAWMKETGYGAGYLYPHDHPGKAVDQEYMPEGLEGREYYVPGQFGFEKDMKKRLDWWKKARGGHQKPEDGDKA